MDLAPAIPCITRESSSRHPLACNAFLFGSRGQTVSERRRTVCKAGKKSQTKGRIVPSSEEKGPLRKLEDVQKLVKKRFLRLISNMTKPKKGRNSVMRGQKLTNADLVCFARRVIGSRFARLKVFLWSIPLHSWMCKNQFAVSRSSEALISLDAG